MCGSQSICTCTRTSPPTWRWPSRRPSRRSPLTSRRDGLPDGGRWVSWPRCSSALPIPQRCAPAGGRHDEAAQRTPSEGAAVAPARGPGPGRRARSGSPPPRPGRQRRWLVRGLTAAGAGSLLLGGVVVDWDGAVRGAQGALLRARGGAGGDVLPQPLAPGARAAAALGVRGALGGAAQGGALDVRGTASCVRGSCVPGSA
eukprot:COSAG01_NODE_7791_length_3055_cov_4.866373_3_plen_201_part_00